MCTILLFSCLQDALFPKFSGMHDMLMLNQIFLSQYHLQWRWWSPLAVQCLNVCLNRTKISGNGAVSVSGAVECYLLTTALSVSILACNYIQNTCPIINFVLNKLLLSSNYFSNSISLNTTRYIVCAYINAETITISIHIILWSSWTVTAHMT